MLQTLGTKPRLGDLPAGRLGRYEDGRFSRTVLPRAVIIQGRLWC